jgi:hypothetical protein
MVFMTKVNEAEFYALVRKPPEKKARLCLKCGRVRQMKGRICCDCEILNRQFGLKAQGVS